MAIREDDMKTICIVAGAVFFVMFVMVVALILSGYFDDESELEDQAFGSDSTPTWYCYHGKCDQDPLKVFEDVCGNKGCKGDNAVVNGKAVAQESFYE